MRPVLSGGVIALVGGIVVAIARATDPGGTPEDHFLAYKTKATKGTAKFVAVASVRLVDRFEDRIVDVVQPTDLLVPVDANGAGIADATTHLQAYAIKDAKVCTDDGQGCTKAAGDCNPGAKCKRPSHVKQLGVLQVDAFGLHAIDTVKPELLLVPSLKSLSTPPPPPPNPASHTVDHYKCYKAKLAKGSPALPKNTEVTLADQLTTPAKAFTLGKLLDLCVPVDKNGEGVINASGTLLCYGAKPAKGAPKHAKRTGVGVNNQFGALTRDTTGEHMLCVPAAAPQPTPTVDSTATTPTVVATGPTPSATPTVVATTTPIDGVPPDPSTVAPPLAANVVTNMVDSTAFLYTGADPIQTGVAPGTIDEQRAALVRGKVFDAAGAALFGVAVSVLDHPELGQTISRADGGFDLVVNGGGQLTIDYRKSGLVPAQRRVVVLWGQAVTAEDVRLMPFDAQVTTVNLAGAATVQVAQGTTSNDADGARHATVLFPPGTGATMVMPNGSTSPLDTLHVRATEFTIGPGGPAAMPGELPPTSGYTYAVELSVDEAVAAGAKSVEFTAPVPFYVENFLDLPVGTLVPLGYYERALGRWIAAPSGRVIAIVSESGGLADVDTDGDGNADQAPALAALGITDGERQRLAELYAPGQELWRAPIPHFTTWDLNFALEYPDDADDPDDDDGPDPDDPPKPKCRRDGSIVECETQTLGEVVPVAGTPYRLHYASDRVFGRRAGRRLDIRLTGPSIPASLVRVFLQIDLAGRHFKLEFPAAPNLTHSFLWDGKDAYGRFLDGGALARVRIAYGYPPGYRVTKDAAGESVNRFGTAPTTRDAAGNAVGFQSADGRVAGVATLARTYQAAVESRSVRGNGLGGWTLSAHHRFDPVTGSVLLGDGRTFRGDPLGQTIETYAGLGGSTAEGLPAAESQFNNDVRGVEIGADGTIYLLEQSSLVRKIGPDGLIQKFAGGGPNTPATNPGDGQPATNIVLLNPSALAIGPDGSVYVVTQDRVRRITPDGIAHTVVRVATLPGQQPGDGGPASDAFLIAAPSGIAVGPDDSVYLALGPNIRRVGPDGIITTIAGTTAGFSGDGGPATNAQLDASDIAVAPDGSLYFADFPTRRIRRIGPDGIMTTAAGTGSSCDINDQCGDGGTATAARFSSITDLKFGPDGTLFVVADDRVRQLTSDGLIRTIAGTGSQGVPYAGDGGLATLATLPQAGEIAFAPDGLTYVVSSSVVVSGQIRRTPLRRIRPAGGFAADEVTVPSRDGGELFVFTPEGRHERTLDALTGVVRRQFAYDASNRLTSITDQYGNATTIDHDASGNPTRIVAPHGQQTGLTVDGAGYLSTITNPNAETVALTYYTGDADGLLQTLTDARSTVHAFAYDDDGRLLQDDDGAGGSLALARTKASRSDDTVTTTTAEGVITTFRSEFLGDGSQRATTTAGGAQQQVVISAQDRRTTTFANGKQVVRQTAADPRFGPRAPLIASDKTTTPGGKLRLTTRTRQATLSDPANPLSLVTQTETTNVNGRIVTDVFSAVTHTRTLTLPSGRQLALVSNADARLMQVAPPGLTPLDVGYDLLGRLISVTQGARSTLFTYGSDGSLAGVEDALDRTLAFGRDDVGRITSITRPGGTQVLLGYDANGNLTSVTPPGRPAHQVTYTLADRLASIVPPDLGSGSEATTYDYDLDGRLTSIVRPNATVTLGHDGFGRLNALTFPQDSIAVTYDGAGRTATVTTNAGGNLAYQYDGDLLTRTTWSIAVAGFVDRTYDADLRTSGRSVNGGSTIAYTYDGDGLLAQVGAMTVQRAAATGAVAGTTLGNVTDAIGYDAFGAITSYTASYNGGAIYAFTVDRDDLGRVTSATETIGGATHTREYGYDLVGRLTSVETDGVPTAAYTYDDNGNRLTGPGVATAATLDAQDRLLQYGTTTFGYSTNGERVTRTAGGITSTYTYDPLGGLRSVAKTGSPTIDYLIDGRGRRIGKRVSGTLIQGLLYQDGLRPIAELDGAGAVVSTFVYATRVDVPDFMVQGATTFRIVSDLLGSPRLVVNVATGAIAQRLDYDAFGVVTNDTNVGFQPFGFAGGVYDAATGLVRFGARDYDAAIGRWTAKDPRGFRGGEANLYAYVTNDPINLIDRTGARPDAAFGAAATAGVPSVALDAISTAAARGRLTREFDPLKFVVHDGANQVIVERSLNLRDFDRFPVDDAERHLRGERDYHVAVTIILDEDQERQDDVEPDLAPEDDSEPDLAPDRDDDDPDNDSCPSPG